MPFRVSDLRNPVSGSYFQLLVKASVPTCTVSDAVLSVRRVAKLGSLEVP